VLSQVVLDVWCCRLRGCLLSDRLVCFGGTHRACGFGDCGVCCRCLSGVGGGVCLGGVVVLGVALVLGARWVVAFLLCVGVICWRSQLLCNGYFWALFVGLNFHTRSSR